MRGMWSLGGFYLAMCAVMFVAQDELLFHPTSIPDDEHERLEALEDVEVLSVEVEGATLQGFFRRGVGQGPRPTVLYFGGNGQSVWQQVERKRWVADMGYNLAFVSYRGYDRSTGSPSGEALTADALAVYDALVQRADVLDHQMLTWGFSLGTGMAVHVACNRPVAAVVLMAPYDTLASVAAGHYPFLPVRWLFQHEVDSVSCGAKVDAPALILHGEGDSTIPADHGKRLADAWGGEAKFVVLGGPGHNDLPSHHDARLEVAGFLRPR